VSKLIRSAIEAKDKVATIRLGFTKFAILGINVCTVARPWLSNSNSIGSILYSRTSDNQLLPLTDKQLSGFDKVGIQGLSPLQRISGGEEWIGGLCDMQFQRVDRLTGCLM
jgi:hypothetical protein